MFGMTNAQFKLTPTGTQVHAPLYQMCSPACGRDPSFALFYMILACKAERDVISARHTIPPHPISWRRERLLDGIGFANDGQWK
jgi:hypothetical protein